MVLHNVSAPTSWGQPGRCGRSAAPCAVGPLGPDPFFGPVARALDCGRARARRCGLPCGAGVAGLSVTPCGGDCSNGRVCYAAAALAHAALHTYKGPPVAAAPVGLTERLAAARGALVAAEMFAGASLVTIEAALAQLAPEEKYETEMFDLIEQEMLCLVEAQTRHDAWQARVAQHEHAVYCANKRGEAPPAPLNVEAPVFPEHSAEDIKKTKRVLARMAPELEVLRAKVRNLRAAKKASMSGLLPDMMACEAARHAAALEQEAVMYGWRKEKRRPITKNANAARKGQRLGH